MKQKIVMYLKSAIALKSHRAACVFVARWSQIMFCWVFVHIDRTHHGLLVYFSPRITEASRRRFGKERKRRIREIQRGRYYWRSSAHLHVRWARASVATSHRSWIPLIFPMSAPRRFHVSVLYQTLRWRMQLVTSNTRCRCLRAAWDCASTAWPKDAATARSRFTCSHLRVKRQEIKPLGKLSSYGEALEQNCLPMLHHSKSSSQRRLPQQIRHS